MKTAAVLMAAGLAVKRASAPGRSAAAAVLLLVLVYLFLCLDGLTRFPIVHGDEMWNAAPAWKLATTGVYGSDLFTGFAGADRRTYQFMPILQLLLAADFKLFGIGLLQLRLLSILTGAVVLWLTYAIGRRVGGPRVGVVSVWLLVVLRISSGGPDTGVVLLDLVRQTRYHIVASAFGLASLLALLVADDNAPSASSPHGRLSWRYMWCGALAGLAFLSHMYGLFWLPALAVTLIVRRGLAAVMRPAASLLLGFVLVCLPWGMYVASDVPSYLAQMRMYGDRFALSIRCSIWAMRCESCSATRPSGTGICCASGRARGWHSSRFQ